MSYHRYLKVIADGQIATTRGHVLKGGGACVIRLTALPELAALVTPGTRIVDDVLDTHTVREVTQDGPWLLARCTR